jgi:uncharacterized protein YdaU (DUF1376 family)
MKEKAPYMPLYGREFYEDVNVLTQDLEEQGAYIRLIWVCWQEGSIPADVALLAAICNHTPVSRFKRKIWPKLCGLFESAPNGRLIHRKIESIRSGKESFRRKCSEAGKVGNERRWGKHRVPDQDPTETRLEPQSGSDRETVASDFRFPISDLQEERTNTCASQTDARVSGSTFTSQKDWFEQWWPTYWLHRGKKDAYKVFCKLVRTEARFNEVMTATTAQRDEMLRRDPAHRPYPATWLRGSDGWTRSLHLKSHQLKTRWTRRLAGGWKNGNG